MLRAATPSRATGAGEPATAGEEPEDDLSDEEKLRGVQIHRVAGRGGAGRTRRLPYKLMPDPDEPDRPAIVNHGPESGQMAPVPGRGAKRYVERGRDGSWELARD